MVLWLYYTKLDGGATNFPLPTLRVKVSHLAHYGDAPNKVARLTKERVIKLNAEKEAESLALLTCEDMRLVLSKI